MTVAELESRIVALEQKVADLQHQLEHDRLMTGVKRGLDDARRGLGKPLNQVDQELRTRHNIPVQ